MRGRFGHLALLDTEEQRRRMIAEYVAIAEGRLVYAAHLVGYSRPRFYKLIHQYRLWPLVNKVRLDRLERQKMKVKHDLANVGSIGAEDHEPASVEV